MLFANPVTFTVATIARVFNFRFTRQEGKTVVSEYFEPSATLAESPTITVKQDMAPKTKERSLVSFRVNALLPDGVTYEPIIVNFTTVFNKQHTLAQRDNAMEMMGQIIASEEFRTGISQRLV